MHVYSSNSSITPAECGVGAVGPELSRGAGAKLCSAPVLCAQDLLDDEQETEADEMTHQAFKHYVNTLAQVHLHLKSLYLFNRNFLKRITKSPSLESSLLKLNFCSLVSDYH